MMYLVETDRDRIFISDLGVLVSREAPVWVDVDKFEKSVLAQELQRKGHIKASKRARSKMSKVKSQAVRMSRPGNMQVRPAAPPPPQEAAQADSAQIRALLEESARKHQEQAGKLAQKAAQQAAQQAVASLMPALHALMANQGTVDIQAQVENAVAKALSGVSLGKPVSSPAGTPGIDFSDPVFIPTGIVASGSPVPEIKVSSQSSDQQGLGDTAAALKKLRTKKRDE